jgi:hypothetical protein
MSDKDVEELIETIKKVSKEASKSKETARKFLRDAGIPVGDEPFGIRKKKTNHA